MYIQIRLLINKLSGNNYLFFYSIVLFSLLLFRNPYSERTLIPNLEPYPDTFQYVVPARNLSLGKGYALDRGFGEIKSHVPPLYSITLIPFFIIYKDPRTFYFLNVVLSILSLFLFYRIIKEISKDKLTIFVCLILYGSNFYFYWYPQFAMAENLLLFEFMLGIFLLTAKVTRVRGFAAGLIPVMFYATKYASAPISIIYAVIYLIKILKRNQKKTLPLFLTGLIFFGFLILYYESITTGGNILISVIGFVNGFIGIGSDLGDVYVSDRQSWFSLSQFKSNLLPYLRGIFGFPTRFLWDFTPIMPKYLAIMSFIGLICGVLMKKFRYISVSLLALIAVQLLFIASFYVIDMRYLYTAIPSLLIGLGLLVEILRIFLYKRGVKVLFCLLIIIFFGFYFITNSVRVKKQIVLNVKYSETPWYYISVMNVNNYFSDQNSDDKPLLISPMPPYYFDYFSNNNYQILPLSKNQEFRDRREVIWGPGDYSDLILLYKDYLKKGRRLYVSTYGLGNEGYLHSSFDDLKKNFELKEVVNGCYNLCKIYQVRLINN